MPPVKGPGAHTTGSSRFDPELFFERWEEESASLLPQKNDLRQSIITAFNLAQTDSYVYHAIASVTLSQVQEAVEHGGDHGLHNWYPDESGRSSEVSICQPNRTRLL